MKIEGKNAVMEALKAGTTIDRLVVAKGLSDPTSQKIIVEAKSRAIKIFFRDKEALERESITKKHQGFIAEITDYKYADLNDILSQNESKSTNIILLLDGIEDPHNLGSIIRVAECMGVSGILIPRHRSVSVNETVIKVSAGASQHIKIAKVTNLNDAIKTIKEADYFVYAVERAKESQNIFTTNFANNTALVIGGEGKGIHALTQKNCDAIVEIPMYGKLNSLNASVACGIALQAVTQHLTPSPQPK